KRTKSGPYPPGAMLTSAGIALLYTIGREDNKFIHQLSMSHEGYWFHESAARVLVAYVHRLLGLDTTPIALGISDRGRYYMAFELEPDEQEDFASRPIRVPALASIGDIYKECCNRAQHLRFELFSATKTSTT